MQCEKCNQEIANGDEHNHAGCVLCDDCYMDVLSPAKSCDPWAVYTATRLGDQSLNQVQEKIMALLKSKGTVTPKELMAAAGVDEKEFKRDMASLRHMELLRGSPDGKGGVVYKLFSDQD